jgi:hypothetical protein
MLRALGYHYIQLSGSLQLDTSLASFTRLIHLANSPGTFTCVPRFTISGSSETIVAKARVLPTQVATALIDARCRKTTTRNDRSEPKPGRSSIMPWKHPGKPGFTTVSKGIASLPAISAQKLVDRCRAANPLTLQCDNAQKPDGASSYSDSRFYHRCILRRPHAKYTFPDETSTDTSKLAQQHRVLVKGKEETSPRAQAWRSRTDSPFVGR